MGPYTYYDKIPLKSNLEAQGVRLVPPGHIRYGAFERGCVVMPGYVNIGAYVGAGSMVDTWATGSCAQLASMSICQVVWALWGYLSHRSPHRSSLKMAPSIGSRCIVVEGVHVGHFEAVLGANVVLTSSTQIIDVTGPEEVIYRGHVPSFGGHSRYPPQAVCCW